MTATALNHGRFEPTIRKDRKMAENALPDSTEQRSKIGAGDRCRLIVAGPAQGFADSLVPQFGSTAICGPNIREDFAKTHWPIVVKAKTDLSPGEVATHLRDIADTLVNQTSWEPEPEAEPAAHPVDEAWEYLDRVAYMVDGDPHLELELLTAVHNRLADLGHLVRDNEKGAWEAIVNLLIRLIANRRRMDGEAESTRDVMTECPRCGAGQIEGCDIWKHHPLCQINGELTNLSDDEVRKVLGLLNRNAYRVVEAGMLVRKPSNCDFFDEIPA